MEIKAITFDVYGTLIDQRGTTWDAMCDILEKYHADADREEFFGKVLEGVRSETPKKPFRRFYELFRDSYMAACKDYGVPGKPEDIDLIFTYIRRRKPYPEVSKVLDRIRGQYKIGIVSNTDTSPLKWNLDDARMSFDLIVTSQSAQAYKPNKRVFGEAIVKWQISAENIVHIGDSPSEDIVPARELGMGTIWVNRNKSVYPEKLLAPHIQISSLVQLEAALKILKEKTIK